MSYIDAFVAAVPTGNRDDYRSHAEKAAAAFMEHGATEYREHWGDDVPEGEVTSFPKAVKAGDGETVVVGWVVWPSREARNAGMEKVMRDPRMDMKANPMPFDGKRMIYGGFETIVEA